MGENPILLGGGGFNPSNHDHTQYDIVKNNADFIMSGENPQRQRNRHLKVK